MENQPLIPVISVYYKDSPAMIWVEVKENPNIFLTGSTIEML